MSAFTYRMSADEALAKTRVEIERHLGETDDTRILSLTPAQWIADLLSEWRAVPIEEDPSRKRTRMMGNGGDTARIFIPIVPHPSNARVLELRGGVTQDPNGSYRDILQFSHYDAKDSAIFVHALATREKVEMILRHAEEMIAYVNGVAEHYNLLLTSSVEFIVKREWKARRERRTRHDQFEADMQELGIAPVTGAVQPLEIQETRTVKLLREHAVSRPKEAQYIVPSAIVAAIADLMERATHSFEGAPQAYLQLGEENLRMIVIGYLNNSFQRTAATGETFTGDGKTDILINPREGEIISVEVKEWSGEARYVETVDQLWSGYVPWHSSIGYVLTYTRRANLSQTIKNARAAAETMATIRGATRTESARRFLSVNVHPRDDDKQMEIHHIFFSLYSPKPTRRGRRKQLPTTNDKEA